VCGGSGVDSVEGGKEKEEFRELEPVAKVEHTPSVEVREEQCGFPRYLEDKGRAQNASEETKVSRCPVRNAGGARGGGGGGFKAVFGKTEKVSVRYIMAENERTKASREKKELVVVGDKRTLGGRTVEQKQERDGRCRIIEEQEEESCTNQQKEEMKGSTLGHRGRNQSWRCRQGRHQDGSGNAKPMPKRLKMSTAVRREGRPKGGRSKSPSSSVGRDRLQTWRR